MNYQKTFLCILMPVAHHIFFLLALTTLWNYLYSFAYLLGFCYFFPFGMEVPWRQESFLSLLFFALSEKWLAYNRCLINVYWKNEELIFHMNLCKFSNNFHWLGIFIVFIFFPLETIFCKNLFCLWLLCCCCCSVTKSCPTLCDPMDCNLAGSSVQGILSARRLDWVAISFSRGSSQPRDQTQVSCIVDRWFTVWATREI